MGKLIDLTGQRFGKWQVIRRATKEEFQGKKGTYWICRCDCGSTLPVLGDSLRQGKSTKCVKCSHNLLIEYDGEQHFKPIDNWSGEEGYKYRKQRDEYKNEWCKKNGIKLLRISYLEYKELNINIILPKEDK